MGAGCGLVGFLVASAVPGIALTMVDSHTRAVEAARLNSANLGIPADVVLSDDGTPPELDGSFDVFVGNPPYYSEYRIADVFLTTAVRALKPGGSLYFELNPLTASSVGNYLTQIGFSRIEIRQDAFGRNRMLKATKI